MTKKRSYLQFMFSFKGFCIFFAVLLTLGAFLWCQSWFTDQPVRISKETTFITEPLTADGTEVDYFKAMELQTYPPEMQTDDNGYRLLARSLVVDKNATPHRHETRYQKLGLDPILDKPTMEYETVREYLKRVFPEKDYHKIENDLLQSAWTIEQHPFMQQWIDDNDAALDIFLEASRKPVFVWPWIAPEPEDDYYYLILPDIDFVSQLVRGIVTRANYRIGKGDIDGAIDDVIACCKIGRHTEKQGLCVPCHIGIRFETWGNGIGINGNSDTPATEEQLLRFIREIRKLPEQGNYKDSIILERYHLLKLLYQVKNAIKTGNFKPLDNVTPAVVLILPVGSYDWNYLFKWTNEVIDKYFYEGDYILYSHGGGVSDFLSKKSRSEFLVRAYLSIPAIETLKNAYNQIYCKANLKQLITAMLIYERKTGNLPPVNTFDAAGNPLHSWRALLLPYLEDEELQKIYEQIRLDEPWDSPHNQQFHELNISVYRCPELKSADGFADYVMLTDSDTLIAEREGDCWMKPDVEIDVNTLHSIHGFTVKKSGSVISPNPPR